MSKTLIWMYGFNFYRLQEYKIFCIYRLQWLTLQFYEWLYYLCSSFIYNIEVLFFVQFSFEKILQIKIIFLHFYVWLCIGNLILVIWRFSKMEKWLWSVFFSYQLKYWDHHKRSKLCLDWPDPRKSFIALSASLKECWTLYNGK